MNVKFAGNYRAAFIAFAAGWVLFALPWLSGQVTIPYDAKAHFQAQLQFLANALHSGQSPFWTHNVFAGSPQVADPQSLIFSPAFLLAYLDPAPDFWEFDLYCFGLLALAGASAIMFFKDRGWHPAGAVVAALAIAFGGSSIWRIQHVKQIQTLAFFMLALWLLARALDRKTLLSGFFAGLAGCMIVIEPGQVALIGCYLLAGYVLNHWLCQPRFLTSVRQTLPALLCGGFVATTLASLPIVFSILFVEDSNRPSIPFQEAVRGSLHPASLLTAIVPNLYSVRGDLAYWGPGSLDWPANFLSMSENMLEVYVGTLPVLLLLSLGFMRGRIWSREIRFFALAIAALTVYALGRYTGLFAWAYAYIPGVDLFRRPADATYALGAMISISAGYFVHLIVSGKDEFGVRKDYAALAILALLFATSFGVAAAHGHLSPSLQPILLSAAIFMAGWLLLLFLRNYGQRYGFAAIALLAGFSTLDLAIGNAPNRSTGKPPSNYEELRAGTGNETIAFLKAHVQQGPYSSRRDRVELVGLGFEWPNIGLIHNFDHVMGYNPLRLELATDGMGASETVAETWERKFTPLYPSYRSLMADMLGLRYIAVKRPIETVDKKLHPDDFKLVTKTSDGYIYENPRALPRVMFASRWLRADFGKLMKDGHWPNFDPQQTVLLDSAPPQTATSTAMTVSSPHAAIELTTYENTQIEIEVNSPVSGFVILNDVWHPWWFATVDGKPAEVLRANVLFRAVQVPAGTHIVRFEFRPVEGAWKEIEARLAGKPNQQKPSLPEDSHTRPEASAGDARKITLAVTGERQHAG